MARPLRVEFPGAFYHVFTRGNDRRRIFRDDVDRKHFLELIAESANRWAVRIHAYALMDNHYHLLVETKEGFLSAPIRHLNGVYTQHYNRRHKSTGHLFHGRFKALVIDRDSYLLILSRYIHQNPVKAKLVSSPEKYRWSSCRAYLKMEEQPLWLETRDTLEQFGNNLEKQVREYANFLTAENEKDPFRQAKGQLALGSDAFVADIKKKISSSGKKSQEHSNHREFVIKVSKEAVVQGVCKIFEVSSRELFSEKWAHSAAKPVVMKYLRDHSRMTLKEIAQLFNVGYSAVHLRVKRLGEQIQKDKDLRGKVLEMERLIAKM